jgi:hypothetical protein
MITLFILALVATAIIVLAVPAVAYALMLETIAQRHPELSNTTEATDDMAPVSEPLPASC